jgi:hypothetical protein
MRQLRDDTHLILNGEVRVYRRERCIGAPPHNWHRGLIAHQNTLARAPARVLKSEAKNKSAIPLNSVVLRHFVSLSVSLQYARTKSKAANLLILWRPHTDSNRGPTDYELFI